MKRFLKKIFGLRDGEIYISFLMQFYIFIVITVLLIVKPTINALFISNLGASNLSYGYLLVALIAVITSYLYTKGIRKHSFYKITTVSVVTFSFIFLGLSGLLFYNINNTFVLFFYYVTVSLFALITTSQFWVFANMVFNPREAKRLFGFIGAGAISGGIFGGYLTSVISKSLGNEYAMLIAALLLLLLIPLLKKVYELRIKYLNIYQRKQVIASQDNLEASSLKLILSSKHLSYVAIITGIGVYLAKLVDFQFSDFAHRAIKNSNDLASFFGFWFSTFNVIALIIQLFFTKRILTRLGISSSLLILPLALGLGSLLFLTFPELWVLVILKGMDGSFKQSLNKSALELSIMPIPNLEKNQAKSYIDIAVDSIATGLAGFTLIFLLKRLQVNSSYITVIILLIIFIWLVVIYKLREAYFKSFKKNIENNLATSSKDNRQNKKNDTIIDIISILDSGEEEKIINILNRVKTYKFDTLKDSVFNLLKHPSNKIKKEALRYLGSYRDKKILNIADKFIHKNDYILVHLSLDYIIEHSSLDENVLFNKYLNHKSNFIRNAALVSFAKHNQKNNKLRERFQFSSRLDSRIKEYKNSTYIKNKEIMASLFLAISYSRSEKHYFLIKEGFHSKKPIMVKYAIKAAGITSDERFIIDLVALLRNKLFRKKAIKSLKKYGPRVIDYLIELDINDNIISADKKYIPKVVSSFNNQTAVSFLLNMLKSKNTTNRLETSKALKKLKLKNQNLIFNRRTLRFFVKKEIFYCRTYLKIKASLEQILRSDTENLKSENPINKNRVKLIDYLIDELTKSFRTLFNLFALIYENDNIKIIYDAILSDNKMAKINSIELLDNILDSSIKPIVIPLIENMVNDEYNSEKSFNEPFNEKKLFEEIFLVGSKEFKYLALDYISDSTSKELKSILFPFTKFKNPLIRLKAEEIYNNLISSY